MHVSDDDDDRPEHKQEHVVFETFPEWDEYSPTLLQQDADDKTQAQVAACWEETLRCNAPATHVFHGGLTPLAAERALATFTTSHEEEFVHISGSAHLAQLSSGLDRPGKSDRASGLCKSDLYTDSHVVGAVLCEAEEPQLGASPHWIRELQQGVHVSFISAEASDPHRQGEVIVVRRPERGKSTAELEEVDGPLKAYRTYEIERISDVQVIKEPPQRPRIVEAVGEDTALNNTMYEHQPHYGNRPDYQASELVAA